MTRGSLGRIWTAAAIHTITGLRQAIVEPLTAVHGIGAKLWSMALADLLLAGDAPAATSKR